MLGHRIAALRRDAGMSQAELARKLRVSPSAIGMYEQGRREPGAELLVAMAEEFHVSVDFLLTGKTRQPQEQEHISQLLVRRLRLADQRLDNRADRPFSRQELAVLFAAMLLEP